MQYWTGHLVTVAAIFLAGCLGPWLVPETESTGGGMDGAVTHVGRAIQASLDRVPEGEMDAPGWELALTVWDRFTGGAYAVNAGINIPPGVEVLAGSTEFQGFVPEGGKTLKVRVWPANGTEFFFRGWVEFVHVEGTSRMADADYLRLGTTGQEIQPRGYKPHRSTCCWPYGPAVDVRLEVDESDPYRITSFIESNQSHSFRAAILVVGDDPIWQEWKGNLSHESWDVRTWTIPSFPVPSEGERNYTVTINVDPDIRVDERTYEDVLVYHVTKSGVEVSRPPPPRTAAPPSQNTSTWHTTAATPTSCSTCP